MKRLKRSLLFTLLLVVSAALTVSAQKGGKRHAHAHVHKGPRGNKVVVVKRSPYRPRKVVVYHPVWAPKVTIHRRWVFFPKYNMYWDNWRNCYVFWNAGVWVTQASAPPVVVNVNLENEKHYVLKEEEEDIDDVYKNNDGHKQEYKSE
jgi:hypothetical protein